MSEAVASRREALHDTIQHRIERYIIDSGSSPGDSLPPQQELAKALGISVPSLREAMKSLQAIGVIEVRHGSGTYVGRFSLDPLVDGLTFRIRLEAGENMRTMIELLEIRMVLESAYVRQVAECASIELIAELIRDRGTHGGKRLTRFSIHKGRSQISRSPVRTGKERISDASGAGFLGCRQHYSSRAFRRTRRSREHGLRAPSDCRCAGRA